MSLWNRFINFMSSQGYLYIGLLLGIIIIYKLILLKGIMMATLFAFTDSLYSLWDGL